MLRYHGNRWAAPNEEGDLISKDHGPRGDFDPALIQSAVALEMLGAKEGIKDRPAQFSFFAAVILLVKEKDAVFFFFLFIYLFSFVISAFDRKHLGSSDLMSCFASRRLDNPAPR